MEVCNLCTQPKELRDSHIFPKFIFNWLKETGTGLLRGSWNMNRRIQDGIKAPFLCQECETLFSKSETYFSNTIFFPVVNHNATQFNYDERLFHFAMSVLWRLLKYDILKNDQDSVHYNTLLKVEIAWREYLLNGKPLENFNQLHLMIGVDPLSPEDIEENNIDVPERFVQYMARATDGGIADNDELCMLYVKLPRFFFIVPLVGFDDTLFINTLISESSGEYILEEAAIIDPTIGDFILDRVRKMNALYENISEDQRQKMRDAGTKLDQQETKNDLGKITDYSGDKYPNNKD